jgi:hypothetical protein
MDKIKKKLITWLNAKLFDEFTITEEKVNNPFKKNEFKTTYPEGYKPFTQWSDNDRGILFEQFKKIK